MTSPPKAETMTREEIEGLRADMQHNVLTGVSRKLSIPIRPDDIDTLCDMALRCEAAERELVRVQQLHTGLMAEADRRVDEHLAARVEAETRETNATLIAIETVARLSLDRAVVIEECVQLALAERDKADAGWWTDASGPAWTMGFSFAANMIGKKLAAAQDEKAEGKAG